MDVDCENTMRMKMVQENYQCWDFICGVASSCCATTVVVSYLLVLFYYIIIIIIIIKYMLLSRHQNAGQNYDIQIANRRFENVAKFRYLGTITNQNLNQEEMKFR
jgi:uncharacterized membrane protein